MGLLDFLGVGKPARLGLTLGGGGARGFAHIAFLKVLDELEIRPAVISGTSMGALMGALYATGHSGLAIERIFKAMHLLDIVSLVDLSWGRTAGGLIHGEKVMRTLAKLTQNRRIEELPIPLKIVATDFWKQSEVVFTQGSVADAVRASISLPGVFEPVVLENQVLVDGSILNSLPYELIRDECDLLVAINVIGERILDNTGRTKPTIFEVMLGSFQIMEAAHLETKLACAQPDYYIKPSLSNVELLDFKNMDHILASVKPEADLFRSYLEKNRSRLVSAA
ncbi:MAG: patatin-like phospholipase family protein [Candidatus Firestonebacteria bacterium]|nr:patatin-like phospholipase family protein [Candidatus Firestonebacteria bacterium]